MSEDLYNMRPEYQKCRLDENDLPDNPLEQFRMWLEEARKEDVAMPTAMVLSSVERDGQPSSRVVLLKKITEDGFIFFTNYNSKKADDMRGHVRVSVLFFWPEMERQVKVSGIASQIDDEESDAYFRSRPRESQLAAWASHQSMEIPDRNKLEEDLEKFRKQFKNEKEIPRPDHWGGYMIRPLRIEFWQGRPNRLHDRLEYRKNKDGWEIVRLAP